MRIYALELVERSENQHSKVEIRLSCGLIVLGGTLLAPFLIG